MRRPSETGGLRARLALASFRFSRPATTSRGTLFEKQVPFIFLRRGEGLGPEGLGEVSLFPGLSADDRPDFDEVLGRTLAAVNEGGWPEEDFLARWPSIAFALESALLDLEGGGRRLLFPSAFTEGRASIPINGLVWMGSREDMTAQAAAKLAEGFSCLKLKIGSAGGKGARPGLGLAEELAILSELRAAFPAERLELRVDANGAFSPEEAPALLERLARLDIHSIEQPIAPGLRRAMRELCAASPLPIALDEELIGVVGIGEKRRLVEEIRPAYLILKPGLLGGLGSCDEWVELAAELGIGWWATSALETAVGLNAIAQWTFSKGVSLPQGLSTGRIFEHPIPSPLSLEGEALRHLPERAWDLGLIDHGN